MLLARQMFGLIFCWLFLTPMAQNQNTFGITMKFIIMLYLNLLLSVPFLLNNNYV